MSNIKIVFTYNHRILETHYILCSRNVNHLFDTSLLLLLRLFPSSGAAGMLVLEYRSIEIYRLHILKIFAIDYGNVQHFHRWPFLLPDQ